MIKIHVHAKERMDERSIYEKEIMKQNGELVFLNEGTGEETKIAI